MDEQKIAEIRKDDALAEAQEACDSAWDYDAFLAAVKERVRRVEKWDDLQATINNLADKVFEKSQELAEAQATVERQAAWIMPITSCDKCAGTGYTNQANGLVCCPIGHAKTCQCRLCQWSQAYYRQNDELIAAKAENTRLASELTGARKAALFMKNALRETLTNMGGIAKPGVSVTFLGLGVPAEAKMLKAENTRMASELSDAVAHRNKYAKEWADGVHAVKGLQEELARLRADANRWERVVRKLWALPPWEKRELEVMCDSVEQLCEAIDSAEPPAVAAQEQGDSDE